MSVLILFSHTTTIQLIVFIIQVSSLEGFLKLRCIGTLVLSYNNISWPELRKIQHVIILDLRLVGNPLLEKDPYCKLFSDIIYFTHTVGDQSFNFSPVFFQNGYEFRVQTLPSKTGMHGMHCNLGDISPTWGFSKIARHVYCTESILEFTLNSNSYVGGH